MDKVAIRAAIQRALSAKNAVDAANKLEVETRQMQEQARAEYKAAVGNLGTVLGPNVHAGVLCDGMLVRVDFVGAFGGTLLVSPVVDPVDVSQPPPPPPLPEPPVESKPAAVVTATGDQSKAEKNRRGK